MLQNSTPNPRRAARQWIFHCQNVSIVNELDVPSWSILSAITSTLFQARHSFSIGASCFAVVSFSFSGIRPARVPSPSPRRRIGRDAKISLKNRLARDSATDLLPDFGLELELEHLLDNDFFDLANNGASEMLIGILDEPFPRSLC